MTETEIIYRVNDQGMIVEEIDEPDDKKDEKVFPGGGDIHSAPIPLPLVA